MTTDEALCGTCAGTLKIEVIEPKSGKRLQVDCPDCDGETHPILRSTRKGFDLLERFLDDIGVPKGGEDDGKPNP